jgi:hypothetical protein
VSPRFRGRISETEENNLKYVLRLGNSERGIKKGLQELCNYYEGGKALSDPTDVRQLVHSHLHSQATLLRRWSLKALGLIGHPDDSVRIVARLRVEQDQEAQTWGAAALLRNADDQGVKEVCVAAGLEGGTAIALAARLYAPDRWLRKYPELVENLSRRRSTHTEVGDIFSWVRPRPTGYVRPEARQPNISSRCQRPGALPSAPGSDPDSRFAVKAPLQDPPPQGEGDREAVEGVRRARDPCPRGASSALAPPPPAHRAAAQR